MDHDARASLPPIGARRGVAVAEFVRAHSQVPPRGLVSRVLGLSPLRRESRDRFEDALEEFEVCWELSRLGGGAHVFHAVPTSLHGATVDHLVIGPAGVFAIHAARTRGHDVTVTARAFIVAGHRRQDLRLLEQSIGIVERCLAEAGDIEVRASGVLVVASPRTLTVGERPKDVVVLGPSALARWAARQPVALSDDEVAALAATASRESTWFGAPAHECVTREQRERFEAVHRERSHARLVRRIWLLALMLGLVGVMVWSATTASAAA
jgi:hypothetical protein